MLEFFLKSSLLGPAFIPGARWQASLFVEWNKVSPWDFWNLCCFKWLETVLCTIRFGKGCGFINYFLWRKIFEKLKYNRWKLMHNFCVVFIIWKPAVERETWSTQAHESVCVNTTQGDQKSHQQFIVVPFCILFSSCVALLGRLGIWYPWPLLPF